MNRYITLIIVLAIGVASRAQEIGIQEAIRTALSQNYSIQISRNNVEISENLATKGQAGLLPTVSASGTADYGNDNIQIQVIGSPTITETKGASSVTVGASLKGQYTVFSGRANKKTYDKLLINSNLSDAQSRIEVESVVMQVISAYYNVLRAQDNYEALIESLDLSEDRLEHAKKRQQYSGGSKINVLSAQVDRNKDSVAFLNATQALKDAEITFNQVLSRDLETPVLLVNEEMIEFQSNYDSLKQSMLNQNWQIQAARLKTQVSLLDYKISRSAYMPQLNFNASYDYQRSESEGSFLQLNQSNGLGLGLTLSIPIYTGGTRAAAVENANIRIKNTELEIKSRELELEASLLKAYRDYERALKIVSMEQSNLQLGEENYDYVKTQFDQGQISNTQMREAQVNLLLIKNNLNNERFNLRLAELELLRLTGALVSDI